MSGSPPPASRLEQAAANLSSLESTPFATAVRARTLPLDAYAGLLECLATSFEALDRAANGPARAALASVRSDVLGRLPLLRADLNALPGRSPASIPAAALHAEMLAERIRLRAADEPHTLLGSVYVLAGPAVALAAPAKTIARCFRLRDGAGTSFVARAVVAARPGGSDRSVALAEAAPAAQAVVAAAREAAAALQAIVAALHPAAPQRLSQLASVLNPLAGNYPIPDDMHEVRAAMCAGARTWERFPYYRLRYPERGREWAWSDSCWLATLARLSQHAVDAQIAWLGKLLAARGMPRLLLEEHLIVLAEELTAARPEHHEHYAKLAIAAGRLADQRREHISDDDAAAVAAAFDALDIPGVRGANLGIVLVAAVADERAGLPGSVSNVAGWLADPQRFPAAWVEAVRATIAAAIERSH